MVMRKHYRIVVGMFNNKTSRDGLRTPNPNRKEKNKMEMVDYEKYLRANISATPGHRNHRGLSKPRERPSEETPVMYFAGKQRRSDTLNRATLRDSSATTSGAASGKPCLEGRANAGGRQTHASPVRIFQRRSAPNRLPSQPKASPKLSARAVSRSDRSEVAPRSPAERGAHPPRRKMPRGYWGRHAASVAAFGRRTHEKKARIVRTLKLAGNFGNYLTNV